MEESGVNAIKQMGQAMTNGLDRILEIAMDYSSVLMTTSQLLCGIAALLYIGSKLWRSWAKGESIDFYAMLRPFATGLMIVFFSGLVFCLDALVNPVVYASEYVRDSAKESVETSRTEYQQAVLEMRNRKTEYERSRPEEEKEQLGVWKSINRTLTELKDSVLGAFETFSSFIFKMLVEISLAIVNVFSVAVVYFYKIYVVTAKIILVLIGPFSLALSVFPGFNANLKSWIAQYLNVSLYVPICNIIGFVQSMIVSECLYKTGTETFNSLNVMTMTEDVINQMESAVTMSSIGAILLGIVAIMLYAHVPTFANWILRGDGSGGLASFFSVGSAVASAGAVANSGSPASSTAVPSVGNINVPKIDSVGSSNALPGRI